MKRYYLLTIIAAIILSLTSCQKPPQLTITSPPTVDLSVDGSSGTISFTANRDWTISTSDSWVSVSPKSGEASKDPVVVRVSCGANTTYDDRKATVTIKMEDLTQTVTITQPANLGIILPSKSYNLESGSNTFTVDVQANVAYSVSTSVDWIKQTGTKGLTSTKYTFSVEENTTYDDREGTITIKSQNSSVADQVISVKQAQKDALIIKDKSFDMPYGGGEIEFKVEANVDFDVKPSVDWIHYVETKALSNSTVRLTVDENPTYEKREGKIEIKQKNGTLSHTITVKQAQRIAVTSISLDKTEIKLKEGETATLAATVKPDNATDKTVTWSSSAADVASVDESGVVTALKEGTATITAKAGDKTATCEVIVSDVPKGNISFADEKLKQRLVAKFDTDGDGELSFAEAAAVTDISNAVTIKTVTSFDEFQYFINVTSIPASMFEGWNLLCSITLPESIVSIQDYAFKDCISITELRLPNKLSYIGFGAFYGCTSLRKIVIPDGVVGNLGLMSITNPSGEDKYGLFVNCSSLEEVVLPNGITGLGAFMFAGCSSLSKMTIPTSVMSFSFATFQGCKMLESIPIPETMEILPAFVFAGCQSLTSVSLSTNLTTIGVAAFSSCSGLSSITIPESVTSIGEEAFQYSGIGSITIPESVSKIERFTFRHCTNLATVVIPESVTSIGEAAFESCTSLESIAIPESVSTIGSKAFRYCTGLKTITIPQSVTSISGYLFDNCSGLVSVNLPATVTYISNFAFRNCTSLTSVILPNSLQHMYAAFSGCTGLTSVTIPPSVTFWDMSFGDCTGLTSITLSDGITIISYHALGGCTNLKTITIPSSVIKIEGGALYNCPSLTEIIVEPSSPPTGGEEMFFRTGDCPIYVPLESVDEYKEALFWKDYATRIKAIQN